MSAATLGPVDIEFLLKGLNFQQEAEKMKSQLRGISTAAQSEADKIDNAFRMAFTGMAAYFTIDAASSFVSDLVRVRGEFQQLDIAFTTMLGSKEKSDKLMAQTVQLAANTPYSLLQIAQVEKGLIAFGENSENVADTVTRLGNIASGTGANISELGQAYGKVMSKGKMQAEELNQFTERGVPIVAELAKMYGVTAAEVYKMVEQGKVGFTDLKQVIKNVTDEGGMFYNLMAKQSKTLTGQISNLGDAWDNMLNQMGTSSEGLLSGGIQTAISIVNNYQDVLDVLKVLIATYGSYKAALILTAVAQKALAAGTFVTEYLKMGRALGFATANQIAFNGALIANPIALAIGAVAGITSLLVVYGTKSRELTLAEKSKAAALDSATASYNQQRGSITMLLETAHKQSLSDKQRLEAITKLKETIPGYNAELSKEGKIINENTAAVENYLKQLELKIKAEAIQGELKKLWSDEVTIKRELKAATAEYNKEIKNNKVITESMAVGESGIAAQVSAFQTIEKASSKVEDVNKRLKENADAVAVLKGEYSDSEKSLTSFFAASDKGTKTTIRSVDVIDAEITKLTAERKARSDSAKVYEEYTSRIAKLEAEKEAITGKEASKERTKEEKDEAKDRLEALKNEMEEKKRLYGEDLYAYQRYLRKKLEEVRPTGNKEAISAINKADIDTGADIDKQFKQLLTDYATYEDKRNAIQQKYSEAWVNLTLKGYDKQAEEAKKQMDKELLELDKNHKTELGSYKYLYDSIDKLSVGALKRRIDRLKEDLAVTAQTSEERLAIEKALSEAEAQLIDRSPLSAIAILDSKIADLRVKIKQAKTEAEAVKLKQDMDTALAARAQAISAVFTNVGTILSGIKGLVGGLNEELAATIDLAVSLAEGFTKIAAGIASDDPMAIVSGGMQSLAAGIKYIIGADDRRAKKKEEERKQRLEKYNADIEYSNSLYQSQLDLLDRLVGLDRQRQLAVNREQVGINLQDAYDSLDKNSIRDNRTKQSYYADYYNKIRGKKSYTYENYSLDNVNNLANQALSGSVADFQKAQAEIDKIRKDIHDGIVVGDTAALEKYLNEVEAALKRNEEIIKAQQEALTGSTYDSMVSAITSGFDDGIYTAEEFAKTFEDLMKKALLNAMKTKWIEAPMKTWNENFAKAMADGILTKDEADALKAEMQTIKDNAAAGLAAINEAGIDMLGDAGSKAEGLSGAIKGMSQDSADLLAGQFGAIRITVAEQLKVMNSSLMTLSKIEVNTRYLEAIDSKLGKMASNSSSGYGDSFRDNRINGR